MSAKQTQHIFLHMNPLSSNTGSVSASLFAQATKGFPYEIIAQIFMDANESFY